MRPDDARFRGTAGASLSPQVVALLRSFFPQGVRLLDVGCGAGSFLGNDDVGIDLDRSVFDGGNNFIQADASRPLPLRSSTFGGVLAKDIIEHLERPQDLMRELHRVATPDGVLVITTPRPIPRAVYDDYTHVRGFTKDALRRLCADTGWSVESIRRMGALPGADRFRLTRHLPKIMAVPGVGHYFGTNWLVTAHRAG